MHAAPLAQLAIEAIQAKNAAAELVLGLPAEGEPLAIADVKAKLDTASSAADKAEAVAAAAMKACEVAVKEEMQAQAVVKVRDPLGSMHAARCEAQGLRHFRLEEKKP
jgi:hypothetical protein